MRAYSVLLPLVVALVLEGKHGVFVKPVVDAVDAELEELDEVDAEALDDELELVDVDAWLSYRYTPEPPATRSTMTTAIIAY
jgi:hypothetical protein